MELSAKADWFEDPTNLRNVRKQLGLSQVGLAAIADGVTSAWIASAETGRIALVGPKAQALWDALGKTFHEQVADRRLSPMAAARIRAKANALLRGDVTVEHMGTMQRLINSQNELIDVYTVLVAKDARIDQLQRQVADLRSLYDAEQEAALAYDNARSLREKLEGV